MLNQFRHLYPQGTIFSELINIDRGLYIVKVSLQDRNIVLGTGFAAGETIEKAEDRARERALMTVNLEKNLDTAQIQQSQVNTTPKAIAQPLTKSDRLERPAQNVTPPSTPPAIPENTEKPLIQTPQAVSSYDAVLNSSPVEITNNHVAIAEPTTQPEPFEEILPPPVAETTTAEENQTNTFEQPITPPEEENQTNIFEQPITPPEEVTIEDIAEEVETIQFDFNDIKHKTDLEMKRLGWTKEQGRDYLLGTYGKRSRLHLTDEELLEFWRYLETLPN